MRVRKVGDDDVKLYDLAKVKLKTAGNTQVVQFTSGNNKSCPVKNISKDEYLDKKTGEVKAKKKSESRYKSSKSVRKSINRLMDLIRCNATDHARCKCCYLFIGELYDGEMLEKVSKMDSSFLISYIYDLKNITKSALEESVMHEWSYDGEEEAFKEIIITIMSKLTHSDNTV